MSAFEGLLGQEPVVAELGAVAANAAAALRGEAGTGMTNAGVFDLSFSWSDGRWQLVGCAD